MVLRAYDDAQRPTLERLDLINVKTLTPRDSWFPAWSWQGGGGIVRERVGDHADHHLAVVYGFGASLGLPGGGLAYALADVDGRLVDLDPQVAGGAGPEVGALIRLGEGLMLAPNAWWRGYVGGLPGENWSLGVKARWTVHPDLALSAEAARIETWDCLRSEWSLRMAAYF